MLHYQEIPPQPDAELPYAEDVVMTREQFDELYLDDLGKIYGGDIDAMAKAIEKRYPKSLDAALLECRARGVELTAECRALELWMERAELICIEINGEMAPMFFASEIDAMVADLAHVRRLTGGALRARMAGITFFEAERRYREHQVRLAQAEADATQ